MPCSSSPEGFRECGSRSTGFGQGPAEEALSVIIAKVNERFGTDFAPEDRYFLDAVGEKLVGRDDIQQAAVANTPENFRLLLDKEFEAGVIEQFDVAQDMAIKYFDEPEFRELVIEAYLPLIQSRARVARQEHCPIGGCWGPDSSPRRLSTRRRCAPTPTAASPASSSRPPPSRPSPRS